jgi:hypothetical protein
VHHIRGTRGGNKWLSLHHPPHYAGPDTGPYNRTANEIDSGTHRQRPARVSTCSLQLRNVNIMTITVVSLLGSFSGSLTGRVRQSDYGGEGAQVRAGTVQVALRTIG